MTRPSLGTDQPMKSSKLEIDLHMCVVQDFQPALGSGCGLDLDNSLFDTHYHTYLGILPTYHQLPTYYYV